MAFEPLSIDRARANIIDAGLLRFLKSNNGIFHLLVHYNFIEVLIAGHLEMVRIVRAKVLPLNGDLFSAHPGRF